MPTTLGMDGARGPGRVQGRITQRQLPEAERSIPGIARYYEQLDRKPATFLQLLWQFEGDRRTSRPRKRRSR
jgi:hypothetical protein